MLKTSLFFCFFIFSPIVSSAFPDFTVMVKKNKDTVVNISSHQQAIPSNSAYNLIGSGFIISKQGYILTNYHVVKEAKTIIVKLNDNREFIASLVGYDKRIDIALLKIRADKLSVVKIGIPEKLNIGEWVVAIGSPYGLEQSVTAGIISAKNRRLASEKNNVFIQSDVVINPGNSGGPLFNLKGEVIGMNSKIYTLSGGYQGLSFAIPIDRVINIANQIKKQGQVSYGWMGIQTQDVTEDLADAFFMNQPYGALISKIIPLSPADEAGFQLGDIIVTFNGQTIESATILPSKVQMMATGKKVSVKIIRQGKLKTITFKVGLLADENDLLTQKDIKKEIKLLGIGISSLTINDRHVFKIDKYGVLVYSVIKDSLAFQFGLQQGDIILNIQGKNIWNVESFEDIINTLVIGTKVAFLIQRKGVRLFLSIEIIKIPI